MLRNVKDELKKEYYEWKSCTGEYALEGEETRKQLDERIQLLTARAEKPDVNQAREKAEQELKLSLLVKRCEDIIASEAFDYVSLFSPMNESTPKQ